MAELQQGVRRMAISLLQLLELKEKVRITAMEHEALREVLEKAKYELVELEKKAELELLLRAMSALHVSRPEIHHICEFNPRPGISRGI